MRGSFLRYLALAVLLPALSGLAACNPKANNPIVISQFSVTGASAPTQGVVPINPGMNGGQFVISWDITGNIYTATVALNSSPVFDPGSNIVLATSCGKQYSGDVCRTTETLNCTFDNSDNMQCSDLAGPYAVQNLAGFLASGIPANAYIVLQACNAAGGACLTESVPVQIQ